MPCEPEISKSAGPTAQARLDLPEGVPPLTSLYMYIAGSCNLACRHCWIAPDFQSNNQNGKFIKLEYVKKAVTEAKPLGLQSVKLTGGEPMFHPKFREIVEYIDGKGISMLMETNGTLIDDDAAKFLKSKPHFGFVSVSLDGAKAETHEALRGVPGSFKKAVSGIKNLVSAGFKPQMICTLHKGNVSEIEDVIKLAEFLGCSSIKFNHVQHLGRGENFLVNKGLTVKEIIFLNRKIEEEIKQNFDIPIYLDIPFAFFSIKKILHDILSRCSMKNILGILSGGKMALCGIGVTVPELVFGDIEFNSIADIWINHRFLKDLRDQIPSGFSGICRDCLFHDICIGHCVASNYHRTGKLTAPYFFCEEAQKEGLFPEKKRVIINTGEKNEDSKKNAL